MAPRTPLLRPRRFFAEGRFHMGRLAVLFLVLLLSVPATAYGMGIIADARLDETVLVDNPGRPPADFCDNVVDPESHGCDAPAKVERDVGLILRGWFMVDVGEGLRVALLSVLLFVVLVHVGAFVGGPRKGGFAETVALALWMLAPTVVVLGLSLAFLWLTLDNATVTAAFETGALPPLLAIYPLVGGLLGTVAAVWGAVILRHGLEHERGLPGDAAQLVAATIGILMVLAVWL